MATVVAVGRGPRIFLVELPGRLRSSVTCGEDPESAGARRADRRPEDLPVSLLRQMEELPSGTRVLAAGPALASQFGTRMQRSIEVADFQGLREARNTLPPLDPGVERTFLRSVARRSLDRALREPDEVLITLAREEERVERALGREDRAREAFLTVPDSPLEAYRLAWDESRDVLARHHARLVESLEALARNVLPNLSAVVGPRVAARLLAAAGGLGALSRMRAPRLQLLGSRRRPSPERGPRYGVLYRADRMGDVPSGRRGAYARSLSAIAAIAARADSTTHRDLSRSLLARRDRRVSELMRGRR